jgi:hypothetical protein
LGLRDVLSSSSLGRSMGESTGKPGSGDGGLGGLDPRAEPTEGGGARPAERRGEPARESFSRPPRVVQRRDPRADPDDDESPSPAASWGRVDVVQVERGAGGGAPESDRGAGGAGVDSLTNAALTLRRELAKLHQQAAAVERTIEDQRRERSDALERVDYANSKLQEALDKASQAETELTNVRRLHDAALEDLQKVRGERDDLARAIEMAKSTAEDLARTRSEADSLREAHDEALRAASKYEHELAEIRKREQAGAQKVSDNEAQLSSLRERLERTTAELGQLREESTSEKSEIARLKQDAASATEATAKVREELEHERRTARDQQEKLEKVQAEGRATEEKLAIKEGDLTSARVDAAEARSEVGRLERDLEAARHARDVNLERASMAERETEGIRKDAERLQRELEAAVANAARAETRAVTAERAKTFVEENVRQLRDEVTTAFARWRTIAPSVPPDSVPPPTRALPVSQPEPRTEASSSSSSSSSSSGSAEASSSSDGSSSTTASSEKTDEPSPATKRQSGSFPPLTAEARPLSMRPQPESSPALSAAAAAVQRATSAPATLQQPPPLELDEDWAVPSPPAGAPNIPRIPPPPSLEGGSEQSPTSRSVPPPLPNPSRSPPRPPPLPPRRGAGAGTIPPVVYPSQPPPAGATQTAPPPPPLPSPPPRPPSIRPPADEPSGVHVLRSPGDGPPDGPSKERDELFDKLSDPATCRAAAVALRDHPEWLKGRPPLGLLSALTEIDYDVEAPIFELARAWEREAITRALVASMRGEPDAKLREHGAWLLKHLGSPSALPALAELVKNDAEPPAVRRWLLEAIERLVASRSIGWKEVGDLVTTLVRHPDPSLRDGVIGVVAALDRSDEKRRLLIDLLRTDDDEIVLASAVHALASALPIELDTAVTERLLGHPSARVQRSVVDFIERSKRAARNA